MSNPETPGGDLSSTPPASPPGSWPEDATVVIPTTPLPPPPGSDPSLFGQPAPPSANPLAPPIESYPPPPGPGDVPWSSGGGQDAAPYPPPQYGAPQYGAPPPPAFGGPPPAGTVPPPGYVPSNPYSGTPYDVGPQGAAPYGAVPYGGYPTPPRTGMAVGSLVCGIVGLVIALVPLIGYVGGLFALVAIPLGFIGLGAAKRQGGAGKGLAIGGIVTGVLAILVCIAWTFLFVLAGNSVEEDPDGFNTDPVDGICNEDRFWQDPDC